MRECPSVDFLVLRCGVCLRCVRRAPVLARVCVCVYWVFG